MPGLPKSNPGRIQRTIQGNPLGLQTAAGNVGNFVHRQTGGFGPVIQDPLNSNQTSIMARFATLGNLLSSCVSQVSETACDELFSLTEGMDGKKPANTLDAATNIAKTPWKNPEALFDLFTKNYPEKLDAAHRLAPFLPYLGYAPPSWELALVFAGGGLNSTGALAINHKGEVWSTNNFLVGSESGLGQTVLGALGSSKIAADGTPLSPITFGYTGGGQDGLAYGIALDQNENVWVGSYHGKNVAILDGETGKPLTPDTGYTHHGQLGSIQGIIATKSHNIWILDHENSQVLWVPDGNLDKAKLVCRSENGKPVDGNCQVSAPFHLAIDQKKRIWITNALTSTVTRFSENNPNQADFFTTGKGPKAIAIDSQGNGWIANFLGDLELNLSNVAPEDKTKLVFDKAIEEKKGTVTFLSADSQSGAGVTYNKGMQGPWGIAVDGNDHIWIADFTATSLVELCGVKTEACPPGVKTGEPISPPSGYIGGGGLQRPTYAAIDSAGNVWVTNNWEIGKVCLNPHPKQAYSTLCGGNGLVVFYGLAKPVKTPSYGPVEIYP